MDVGPDLDSGRVERSSESGAGERSRLQTRYGSMDERDELKCLIYLGDDRSGLGAQPGNRAAPLNVCPGRRERAFRCVGTLGHGAFLACHMLPL